MPAPLILVVEDDSVMRGVLTVALRCRGYDVRGAENGRTALRLVAQRPPDAILLDLGLPDIDGFELMQDIRREHELPILVLSARNDESAQIRALDAGANDYVTKPVREGELMARLRVALRRPRSVKERGEIRVGDLRLDVRERRAFVNDREVFLTRTEFELVHLLACQAGRVITHQQILREVWGKHQAGEVQYLRVYVRQLRQKLEDDPSRPSRIVTAFGVGYRMTNPVDAE